MDKLSDFLSRSAGREDCIGWLADWYVLSTGKADPALHLRGLPDPQAVRGAHALSKSLGLMRTTEPRRGDVGLVSLYKGHLVGAIYTGSLWCMLSDQGGIGGVLWENCRFVAAWRIA